MEFVIYGHGHHSIVKARQLQGAAQMTEVAIGMGTVSEWRAHLVRKLGEYSSHVYSADVIAKARSEVQTALHGGTNVHEELRVLHATMKPTIIRGICTIPFYVLLWSKSMLECYTEMVHYSGRVELYMDATGGKMKKVDDKAVYVTSVVVANAMVRHPQVAVGMMLSNCHNTATYSGFLQQWWSSVSEGRIIDLPAAIVVDMNWPSIHTCASTFCGMSIVQYLQSCMAIVQGHWTAAMLKKLYSNRNWSCTHDQHCSELEGDAWRLTHVFVVEVCLSEAADNGQVD